MRRHTLEAAVNVIGVTVVLSVSIVAGLHFSNQSDSVPAPFRVAAAEPPLSYLGVYEPSSPHSYSGILRFSKLIGRLPNLALYYSSWWEPFQISFARAAQAHGATTLVQLEPRHVDLSAIAAGRYDGFLKAFARSVRSFGHPVVLSFGHEMNANWYGWGYRHISPSEFIAAWRHIHQVFTSQGADNVIWLWTVNVVCGPDCSPTVGEWWPGSAYVTWVGIDGHYFTASVKFASLFGATLGQVRAFTHDPILISEAGIAPFVATNRITDLFAGARAHGLLGVVWFDVQGHNLRIEGDPKAIALFRLAVRKYVEYGLSSGTPAGSRKERNVPD